MTLLEILAIQAQNRKGIHTCYYCGEEWDEQDMKRSVNDGWICDDCSAEYEAEIARNRDYIWDYIELEDVQFKYWYKYIFKKVLKDRMFLQDYYSLEQRIKDAVQYEIVKAYRESSSIDEKRHDEFAFCFKDKELEHPEDDYLDFLYDRIWR